ncbi:fructose-2,6-bisphosphatase TIGAR-like isoform X1 [Dermacentor andersoni]|uniref:fructose-2,6-bisphosphatase TIGAR-like isoform X1 n=2 Tax=Dermacentor TaxID=34619 RepID=UPI0021553033|nr:fructose-2,6-bisphosphatase TIGAR-like isoform X1 [Dermacentor andersoni]
MFALTLVRHGETLHNKDNVIQGQLDVPLSSIGLEQAELLGKHLQQQRFTHVYSSDLSRAKQTAMSILEKNRVTPGPIIEDQRLRERKFGTVEGQSFGYLKEASNKANQSVSSFTPPGAETLDQVRKRAVSFFEDLCQLLRGAYLTEDQENLSPSKRKREEQTPSLPSSLSSSPSAFPPSHNSPSSATTPSFADELIRAALGPSTDDASIAATDPAPNVSLSPLVEQWPATNPPRKLSACSSSDEGDGVGGGGALLASILVVSHGALLREMVRHLVEDLGCCVPGGRSQALRISPNAGISKFTVSGPRDRPRIVCHLIHDRQHLMGGSACPIVSSGESIPRRREMPPAGLSADATAL